MSNWLDSVPYGGHSQGPIHVASSRGWLVGQSPPSSVSNAVVNTLVGLTVVGGVGALLGWFIGGSRGAAMVGALFGISAGPQVVSAIACARNEGP